MEAFNAQWEALKSDGSGWDLLTVEMAMEDVYKVRIRELGLESGVGLGLGMGTHLLPAIQPPDPPLCGGGRSHPGVLTHKHSRTCIYQHRWWRGGSHDW